MPLRLYYAAPASAVILGPWPTGGNSSSEHASSAPCRAGRRTRDMAGYEWDGGQVGWQCSLAPAGNGTCWRAVLVVIGPICRLYSGEVVRSIGGVRGRRIRPHVADLCRSEAAVFQQAVGRPALAVFGCPEPERFPEEASWAPMGVPGRSAPVARGYHCACSGYSSAVLIVSRRPVFA